METKKRSPQFMRRRRFFLVLPLLVLPFTTLLFWALGGGTDAQAGQQADKGGLNMQLPDAYLKEDGALTKLSYYEKAAADSAKLKEQLKSDPNYKLPGNEISGGAASAISILPPPDGQRNAGNSLNPAPFSNSNADPNEAKVYQKLSELNKALNSATAQPNRPKGYSDVTPSSRPSVNSADIDRLEQMMAMTKGGDDNGDPEMAQLNEVMEKILDLRHPERVKEKLRQNTEPDKGQTYTVSPGSKEENISLLGKSGRSSQGRFFSLMEEDEENKEQAGAIQAVIHETQTISDGSVVKLRLMNDMTINHTVVPKGSFVFGTASLNGERLAIKISSLRYKTFLFPVQLSVVDLDGMDGIYIPGTPAGEVAKGAAERAIQGIGIGTFDPSLGAKAATAGIEAARTLLSKKVKQVNVTLTSGYQVLLRDEKQTATF